MCLLCGFRYYVQSWIARGWETKMKTYIKLYRCTFSGLIIMLYKRFNTSTHSPISKIMSENKFYIELNETMAKALQTL